MAPPERLPRLEWKGFRDAHERINADSHLYRSQLAMEGVQDILDRRQSLLQTSSRFFTARDFDGTQAYRLSELVPGDVFTLATLVNDETLTIEQRSKVLEVMVFRGALNEYSYAEMTPEGMMGGGALGLAEYADRQDEFKERRLYQETVRDLLFAHPEVFAQLSDSKDLMPQGRFPATECMNTLLRAGGIYGDHDRVQDFEEKVLALSPEVRGRMVYHILDAARNSTVHLNGGTQLTGWSIELSAGNSAASLGFGVGAQWEHLPDHHWQRRVNDFRGDMSFDLETRDQAYWNEQAEGFVLAARRAGKLPGEPL
jgi:hypothetical protein